jgi:hypothetical protein
VNKVFLTGRLKIKPEVMHTPKGEKILKFSLWVEDDAFSIDVVYLDRQGINDFTGMTGNRITVSGSLTKSGDRHDGFKLKAHKIIWMEE